MTGGWSSVDFGGVGFASTAVHELDAGLTAWATAGGLLAARAQVAIAPLAGGHRMLVCGRAVGAPADATADVHLLLD